MRQWPRWIFVATLFLVVGCGGGSTTTPATTVTVIISPTATQTVFQGGTVSYTATVNSTVTSTGVVTNITSTGVTWQVDGTTGGVADTGTISTTGVYTAPTSVAVSFQVTITAVSVQDTSATTSALLNVDAEPEISLSPTTATVAAGQAQAFPLTFSSGTNSPVTWEVNNVPGGNATVGAVVGMVTSAGVSEGVYTAPQVPPVPGAQVTVTAVLNEDTTQISSATVTDTYSQASLSCSYAFLIRGENTHGPFLRAGTFTADGMGNLTGGVEDVNGGGITASNVPITGSYTVSADGRGTMVFQDSYGSHFGGGNSTFSFVIVSARQLQVAETDTFATGSGEADLQSSCSPAASAISGEYVFDFSGTDVSANPLSIVGEFNSSGAALEDSNDFGTLSPSAAVTFASVVGGANGRSTATFTQGSTTTNFAFYEVSTSQLVFIELDSASAVGGEASLQTAPGAGFNLGNGIGGALLVTTKGTSINSSAPFATVASFSASGGTLSAGSLVRNNSGTGNTGTAFTGSDTVAASGRGTISLSTGQTYVVYLSGIDQGVVQETDTGAVGDGSLMSLLTASPPALTSLSGSFALQWSGAGTNVGEQDASGEFVALSGSFESGTLDSNTANRTNPSFGFTSSINRSLTPTSPYRLPVSNGVMAIAVPSSGTTLNLQFAVFFTSQTSAVLLRVDTLDTRALSGLLLKQF